MKSSFGIVELYIAILSIIVVVCIGYPFLSKTISKDTRSVGTVAINDSPITSQNTTTGTSTVKTSSSTTEGKTSTSATTKTDTKTADKDAYQLYYWSLPLLIGTQSAGKSYPSPTAASWDAFTGSLRNPVIDPYTLKPPVFTVNTPKTGEIQYISPGTCSSEKPLLEKSNIIKTFAYRAYVAGKIMCYSNINGTID